MIDDVARLREQAQRARRLARTVYDELAIRELNAYATECEVKASTLADAQKAASEQKSRF